VSALTFHTYNLPTCINGPSKEDNQDQVHQDLPE